MANNDKLPYLSEIIDLERDILPHRVVLLHAGVGAGKNTWTKSLGRALPYFGYSVTPFGRHGTNWHIAKVCTTK